MKARIQQIAPLSLGRMGCLLGIVAAFLPSLLCGLSSVALAGVVQHWLSSWQDFTISILGREVATIDFVRLLQLESVVDTLRVVTGASALTLAAATLGLALVTGLLLAAITMLVGLAYNALAAITGGVVVEVQEIAPRE